MKPSVQFPILALIYVALAFVFTFPSRAQSPLVTIETVTVGDVNNGPDDAPFGPVSDVYRIGKYEVTLAQYTAFLNAVAKTDIYNLWNASMESDPFVAGISRSGSQGSYSYSVIGSAARPVTYVSWFDAARFCNWLYNGATNGADTENGSYALNGATNGNGFILKNPGATWQLPTENEWYKAAYYDPTSIIETGGYWLYAMRSDDFPGNTIGADTNQANFRGGNTGGYCTTPGISSKVSTNYLTDVGAFSSSLSYYGTYDQSGNVREWAGDRLRGGYWDNQEDIVSSASRGPVITNTLEDNYTGFRVSFRNPPPPQITVHQTVPNPKPSGPDIEEELTNGTVTVAYPPTFVGATSASRTYIIRNSSFINLTNIVLTKHATGTDAPDANFQLAQPATNSLGPFNTTTFTVTFAPVSGGLHTAQVSITSNDTNNSPFILNFSGLGMLENTDTDGDGLNDDAEIGMSALGFDWQVAQTNLVGALYTNAGRAKLFSETQYNSSYTNGVSAGMGMVLSNPASHGLYTPDSIMDLRMGGLMVQKQGSSAIVTFQPQTTTDLTQPFTNNGTPITNAIPMPGNKGFIRIRANPTPSQ